MPNAQEQIAANRAKRQRAMRIAVEVAAWVALAVAVVITLFALAMKAHFDCGGTLGGYGEGPDARLDRSCYDRATSNLHLVLLIVPLAALVRIGLHRRRTKQTQRPRRLPNY